MSMIMGITFGQWTRLLRENHYAIDAGHRKDALLLTVASLFNSRGEARTARRFGAELGQMEIKQPVFILGHWRSGTTLLHNLLSIDEQFAFPNLYEISNPSTFLIREPIAERALKDSAEIQRPMDEIHVNFRSPGEDEAGLAVMSLRSPLLGWTFPRNALFYDRFLNFRDADAPDMAAWKTACLSFFRALSYRYGGKTLLLKSPTHTAKIRYLLEMFPDARFVHIRRHPYAVFRSTEKLYQTEVKASGLQRMDDSQVEDGILRRYRLLYDAYFEDRALIPAGRLHELAFEDLERDKLGQVAAIYQALQLPGFDRAEPQLRAYVDSLAGYQKNRHPEMSQSLRRKICEAAGRSFAAWNYAA